MYTLYYSPGACSLATHTILNILDLQTELVFSESLDDFQQVNPAKMVPVLKDGETLLTEGAAIILYLLNKHENNLFPADESNKQKAIQNMMMANASMHPAYGRLFFAGANMQDGEAKSDFMKQAAIAINNQWQVVEQLITDGPYLGGETVSPADILLAVYSRWGQFFPVDIEPGPKAQKMIDLVLASDAFCKAFEQETQDQKRYAQ